MPKQAKVAKREFDEDHIRTRSKPVKVKGSRESQPNRPSTSGSDEVTPIAIAPTSRKIAKPKKAKEEKKGKRTKGASRFFDLEADEGDESEDELGRLVDHKLASRPRGKCSIGFLLIGEFRFGLLHEGVLGAESRPAGVQDAR